MKKTIKKILKVLFFLFLGYMLLMLYAYLIMVLPTYYDRSLNRDLMYYDLGEGRIVTVMLQDTMSYVMPYRYEGKTPPSEDYIYFKRYHKDQYIFLYFKKDNEIVLGPNWNIEDINFKNYKYEVFGKYSPISFRKRSNYKEFETSEHCSAIITHEKNILDSLSAIPNFNIVFDGKPIVVQFIRVDDKKVTSHMYRGHKEDKNMSYIIR